MLTVPKALGVFALGMLVAGTVQYGACVYSDLRFLHKARMDYEQVQRQPRPAPKPAPPVQGTPQ